MVGTLTVREERKRDEKLFLSLLTRKNEIFKGESGVGNKKRSGTREVRRKT